MACLVRLLGTFVDRRGGRMVCLMGGHLGMRSDDGGLCDDWGKGSCFCCSMGVLCELECYELKVIKLGLYHKVGNRISSSPFWVACF